MTYLDDCVIVRVSDFGWPVRITATDKGGDKYDITPDQIISEYPVHAVISDRGRNLSVSQGTIKVGDPSNAK